MGYHSNIWTESMHIPLYIGHSTPNYVDRYIYPEYLCAIELGQILRSRRDNQTEHQIPSRFSSYFVQPPIWSHSPGMSILGIVHVPI